MGTFRPDTKDAGGVATAQTEENGITSPEQASSDVGNSPITDKTGSSFSFSKMSLSQIRMQRPSLLSLGGRDGGGSKSGASSVVSSFDGEEAAEESEGDERNEEVDVKPTMTEKHLKIPWQANGAAEIRPRSLSKALRGELGTSAGVEDVDGVGGCVGGDRVMADALGDQSEDEKTDAEEREEKEREKSEMRKIVEEEKRERGVQESVY